MIYFFRYLSAERARNNWISAAQKISPGIEHLNDDDVDFLAASISSHKSICSGAFDFLFDSTNLNPEKIQEEMDTNAAEFIEKQQNKTEKSSGCCVIAWIFCKYKNSLQMNICLESIYLNFMSNMIYKF